MERQQVREEERHEVVRNEPSSEGHEPTSDSMPGADPARFGVPLPPQEGASRESRMTEVMESEKGGFEVSHFDLSLGVLSDGNYPDEGSNTLGRKLRCQSHLRTSAYRGWPFQFDTCWIGLASEPGYYPPIKTRISSNLEPEEERLITCPIDRKPFHPTRADNIYCSDRCRRTGSRMGGVAAGVGDRMESDSFMRICEGPGCEESLAGRKASARFHAAKCRKRAAYHRKRTTIVPFDWGGPGVSHLEGSSGAKSDGKDGEEG